MAFKNGEKEHNDHYAVVANVVEEKKVKAEGEKSESREKASQHIQEKGKFEYEESFVLSTHHYAKIFSGLTRKLF